MFEHTNPEFRELYPVPWLRSRQEPAMVPYRIVQLEAILDRVPTPPIEPSARQNLYPESRSALWITSLCPHPGAWTLLTPQAWTLHTRLAVIPWTLLTQTNSSLKYPSNSFREKSPN
jgi:hypothetical protein